MKIFYYVHTGHRIGLDRFRRAAAILKGLQDEDITLLTSDYRIAQVARDFGIEKSVGIDVVRNIPQITHHGDKLIFDSEEANPLMLEDMRKYFSTFIRVSDNPHDTKEDGELLISPYLDGEGVCNAYAIDEEFFQNHNKTIKLAYFFGDDDYSKDLMKHFDFIADLQPQLQLGFYYFLDYEDELKQRFKDYHEFEDYNEMIQKTEILITASPQAALENLASGGKPIYVQREDYSEDYQQLLKQLNIPIVSKYDKNILSVILQTINNHKYAEVKHFGNIISKFIKESLIL